ncbi:hypothetical protein VPH35_132845 [Triticum aestivum]
MPSSSNNNSMQGRGRGGVLLPPRASSLSERHPTSSERCMCGWQQINLLLNPCASSVDDDDNQGIHRHDDTPHMVQLGYNLLYRATAAAVVFGIDYNLLSGSLVHYTDCMPPLSSLPRLPHHRHRPSAFSFDAVVDS